MSVKENCGDPQEKFRIPNPAFGYSGQD